MATMEVNGIAELQLSMEELAEIPDEVLDNMLNAEADVIEKAQKEMALSMGVYQTGKMANSIKRGKIRRRRNERSVEVYPQGSRTRGNTTTREAEIAFINEFGKGKDNNGNKQVIARPFIRNANELYADEAVGAAEDIWYDWTESL